MRYTHINDAARRNRKQDAKPPFNFAIVYDDRMAATRAMNVFTGLLRQFGDEFDFHCDLWRFDILEISEALEEAVRAGEAADLIIISARRDRELPVAVKGWLDRSVAAKAQGSAALVGLLESRQPSADNHSRTRHFLQTAADRSLMDLFLCEVDLPRTSPGWTPEDVQARANAESLLLEAILCQAKAPTHHRVWMP